MIPEVTDATFANAVLKASLPVLVDFYGTWCAPCTAMLPGVEDIASEYRNELIVFKLDIDKNPAIVAKHGVRTVPTLMLFRDGEVVKTMTGTMTRSRLATEVDAALENAQ